MLDSYTHRDEGLVVRCISNNNSFMLPVNSHISYEALHEEVRSRFNFRRDDIISLQYSLPGCAVCFLQGERDFELLLTGSRIYKVDRVEIVVSKENVKSNSVSIVSNGESCSTLEEDEHLGSPFRCEVAKPFLSDEWATYIRGVGQRFSGGVNDFRDQLRKYAIGKGFKYEFHRNDGVRVHVVCDSMPEGVICTWYINGSVASTNGSFYIHDMNNVHTCKSVIRTQKHPYLNADVIMPCIESDVMYNMSIRPKAIISKFKASYGFDITYKVALKAREKAKEKLFGRDVESFNKLSWFRDPVLQTNPGSYFELEVDPTTSRFKRLFVAYGGCISGFQLCLPVLYVDGAFGKSVYKGQILSATGRNGNKGMFPLAMCVCDSETEDNWNFFFHNLKKLLKPHRRVITFISDRGNGLLSAFDKIFPGNPHLYCYKHLTFNLAKRYTGRGNTVVMEKVKEGFFKLAYSSTEKEYYHNLKVLRDVGGAGIIDSFLSEIPVEHWCRAFYKSCRYGIMANGMAECFNSWINFERLMPVYCFLEQTRIRIMEMNGERRAASEDWVTRLTPELEDKLETEMDKGRRFNVHYSSPGLYEVISKYSYTVNLNDRTCSCVKWQINCFPCPHALAAIQQSPRGNVYDYIDFYFHADTFKRSYSFPIYPVSNVDQSLEECSSDYILPLVVKRPPGRRRNKRMKSGGEFGKKTITCGRCGQKGNHNRLTCTEAINHQ